MESPHCSSLIYVAPRAGAWVETPAVGVPATVGGRTVRVRGLKRLPVVRMVAPKRSHPRGRVGWNQRR